MLRYEFQLRISAEQYLDYYRGIARHVIARSHAGETVQFPASLLQRFVSNEGINGEFALTCDDDHKSARLERLRGIDDAR